MAQPATTPKIEELRFRLKADAKSRLFYPLAEELRKVGQFAEAEHVLRTGLVHHPSYLSAWVSLGRVSRDMKNEDAAVEALNKALQLDPGNVVAARLLADSYLALGDKLEALKKYKLVHALLPGDEELEAVIERLDNELNPITIAPEPVAEPEPEPEPPPPPPPQESSPFEETMPTSPPPASAPSPATEEMPWGDQSQPETEPVAASETRDEEPMHVAHSESPFEEPVTATYSAAAFEIEAPQGLHVARAPLEAEMPTTFEDELTLPTPEAPVHDQWGAGAPPARTGEGAGAPQSDESDLSNTLTMADLYARQGLTDDARNIYEAILQRDPDNSAVREKLDALNAPPPPPPAPQSNSKVARLENWLSKVARREDNRV